MPIDLAADAAIFSHDFGESIVYRPKGISPRTITANVFRDLPGLDDGRPSGSATPQIEIAVDNNNVTGIARSELDRGLDIIELAVSAGGDNTQRKIAAVISEDSGVLTLRIV